MHAIRPGSTNFPGRMHLEELTLSEVLGMRLAQLRLLPAATGTITDLVAHLGAVQAQDYGQARRALGVRLPGTTAVQVETALQQQTVMRCWLFRGTLHLVLPEDLRWMNQLAQPPVRQVLETQLQQAGIDSATQQKSLRLLETLLPQPLARTAIAHAFAEARLPATGQAFRQLLHYATSLGLICHGARVGNDESFVLLDAAVATSPKLLREEALARLALRYFGSRGPATETDLARWAGIPLRDARSGIAAAGRQLQAVRFADETYWLSAAAVDAAPAESTLLLPGFDEYILGYKDRSLFLDPARAAEVVSPNGLFSPVLLLDGKVCGKWKLSTSAKSDTVQLRLFGKLPAGRKKALDGAVRALATFSSNATVLVTEG